MFVCLVCFYMYDLILYVPSTIFQLYRVGSSLVEPVLARTNVSCSRTQRSDPVRLEPAASRSRVKHSTTEPLRSQLCLYVPCGHLLGKGLLLALVCGV